MLELCRAITADGLMLDGTFQRRTGPDTERTCALLLIHGTGGNFYGAGILAQIADQASQTGYAVLRVNTRGHDLVASIPGTNGPVRGGAAYEQVADAHLDITAWVDWLSQRSWERVMLVGHSLGGVKAFWSQAVAAHASVCGVIGLNPPRFSHQRFQADPRCTDFRRDYTRAEQLVRAGEGGTLLTVTQPLPLVITAAGYLEKYGPDDPLDYVPILPRLHVPQLIVLGGQIVEANPAFDGLLETLSGMATAIPSLSCELIPGADINFRNDPREPWRRITKWLDRVKA